jgi:hypothetical protein
MAVSQPLTLPDQLRTMRHSVDAETGAILFRHPTLQGIPDLVVEGDGYTMEFIGPTLLCLDIIDPGALGRLAGRTHQAAASCGPWPLTLQSPTDLAALLAANA